tara:strand:- start:273 stop:1544 length:1272 start_codon:yes stop_codon:yes gene_type:complete
MNNYYLKYIKYKKKYLHNLRNNILISNSSINQFNNKLIGGINSNNNFTQNNLGHYNIKDQNIILYAIGDIHGDYEVLKHILTELLNVADYDINNNTFEWKANNVYLIFNGDLVDRGGRGNKVVDIEKNDIKIIENLINLKEQSKLFNSDIILLCGNHELMIFNQDFRYSTLDKSQKTNINRGSLFATKYSNNVLGLLRINNILFTHGGICEEMFKSDEYSVDFQKVDPINYINNLIRKWLATPKLTDTNEKKDIKTIISGDSASPMWCRTFGHEHQHKNCGNDIELKVFQKLKKYIPNNYTQDLRMIIAHTKQSIGINSKCDGKVWRIDTGMSRAFDTHISNINDKETIKHIKDKHNNNSDYRKIQVLQIKMDQNGLYTQFEKIVSNYRAYDLIQNTQSLDKYFNYKQNQNYQHYSYDLHDYI